MTAHRIRTLKPEMWHSEDVMTLSAIGRLTWVVLITIADDEGRVKTSARHLHDAYLREPSEAEVQTQLDLMQRQDMITQYQVDGRGYIQIVHWQDHQRVQHPSASRLPDPSSGIVRDISLNGSTNGLSHEPSGEVMSILDMSALARAQNRSEPIRADPTGTTPDPRACAREGVKHQGSRTAPNATSSSAGKFEELTDEAKELLAGFQAITGRNPSKGDQVDAEDFVVELGRRLSVEQMVERMQSYVDWCDANKKERPWTLKRFWESLRRAADHEVDVAVGYTGQAHSQQEEDPF